MDTKVREFFRERYKITGEEALSEMEKLTEFVEMKRGDILYKITGEEALSEMEKLTEFVEMKRGDILMAQGEIPKKVFFQIDGIIRGLFVGRNPEKGFLSDRWDHQGPFCG